MAGIVGCGVFIRQDPSTAYFVASRHYDDLRDRMDRKERGWIELDSPEGEGGKTLVRLEDIIALILQTESVIRAAAAREVVSG